MPQTDASIYWQSQRPAVLRHAHICCRHKRQICLLAHHVRVKGWSRWPAVLPRALEVLQADGAGLGGVLLAAQRGRLLPPQLVDQRLAPPGPPARRPIPPACIKASPKNNPQPRSSLEVITCDDCGHAHSTVRGIYERVLRLYSFHPQHRPAKSCTHNKTSTWLGRWSVSSVNFVRHCYAADADHVTSCQPALDHERC